MLRDGTRHDRNHSLEDRDGHVPIGGVKLARALVCGAFGLFLFILLKNAWVSDDAYITFRSLEQLVAGNGMRWNPDERVQVYTSPLWFFLLLGPRLLSENLFIIAIILSALLGLLALAVSRRVIGDATRFLIFVLLIGGCWAVMDFSTSGLENPLVYCLIAAFLFCYLRYLAVDGLAGASRDDPQPTQQQRHWLRGLFLVLGLLSVTRHDSATLVFVPTAYIGLCHIRRYGVMMLMRELHFMLLPLMVWTIFSLIYYGVAFPNTAYAKMLHGLPGAELSRMGISYLVVSFTQDLFAALIVVLLTLRMLARRELPILVLWLGVVLNLGYVASIGGDFMKGRFISVAVFYAALALMSEGRRASGSREERAMPARLQLVWVLLLIVLMVASSTPIKLSPRSGLDLENEKVAFLPNRVVDERDFYFKTNSLWAYWQRDASVPFPDHMSCRRGIEESVKDADITRFRGIGMFGYCADLELRIVDRLGISDPFLARLPVPAETNWHAGHYARVLPPGYWNSRRAGRNLIQDEHLAALLTDVMLQTRGALFTEDRFRALWRLNSGHHDDVGPHYFASLDVARSKVESLRARSHR